MNVRRVVTGQRSDGKSVFVRDEEVEPLRLPLMGGVEFRRVWGGDETTTLPTGGAEPSAPTFS